MSRTHYGKRTQFSGEAPGISATEQYGPLVGNYVTLKLFNKVAVATATPTVVDSFPLPMGFMPCAISFNQRGATTTGGSGYVQAAITNDAGTAGTGYIDVSGTTPVQSLAGSWPTVSGISLRGRDSTGTSSLKLPRVDGMPKGDIFKLVVKTDDGAGNTSTLAAGGLIAHITGYFLGHIQPAGRYAESGQARMGGPVAGFYDVWTLQNLIAAPASLAPTGSLLAPCDARIMAVYFGAVAGAGYSAATGTITAVVRNGTTSVHATVDVDASVASNGGLTSVYQGGTPALVGNQRNIARGDTINLSMSRGASDVFPVGCLTAHILVWVKGHYDASTVADWPDQSFYNAATMLGSGGNVGGISDVTPSAGTANAGPVLGGLMVLPLFNKVASGASLAAVDVAYAPMAGRVYAMLGSKVAASSSTQVSLYSGSEAAPLTTQMITNWAAQTAVLHNEGTSIQGPVTSIPGGVVAPGMVAGEQDIRPAVRRVTGGLLDLGNNPTVLAMSLNVAGASLFAASEHILFTPHSHVYDSTSLD